MRKGLQLILLVTLFSTVNALARAKDSVYRNFVALNISAPVLDILAKTNPDTSVKNINPATIYIGRQTKRLIFRLGASGSNYQGNSKSQLFSDKKTESITKLRGIFSMYGYKQVLPKWEVQYGLNLTGMMYWNDQLFDSGFDVVNIYNRSWGAGIAPGILFRYDINKRIKLGTEYMLLFQYINSSVGKRFSAIPNQNYTNSEINEFGFQFSYPISIYLQYHF